MSGNVHPDVGPALFDAELLEQVFARCFGDSYHPRLQGGAAEPLYQPAREPGGEHVIFYREDYFASALHEVAHWCIAGVQRRKLVDFGYWYAPDGRNTQQQKAFEQVEYQPQALEWLFSRACGYAFSVSVDNLDGEREADTTVFRRAIFSQAVKWQDGGMPARGAVYFAALASAFDTCNNLAELQLRPQELGL